MIKPRATNEALKVYLDMVYCFPCQVLHAVCMCVSVYSMPYVPNLGDMAMLCLAHPLQT